MIEACDLLTLSAAAKLAGMHISSMCTVVKRGRLAATIVNGRQYVRRVDVVALRHRGGVWGRHTPAKSGDPALMTLPEAATLLGVTRGAIELLVKNGRLAGDRSGPVILVSRAAVEARRMLPDDPAWMTVPEAAAALGVDDTTIARWIKRGDLEAETPRRPRIRVSRASVEARRDGD